MSNIIVILFIKLFPTLQVKCYVRIYCHKNTKKLPRNASIPQILRIVMLQMNAIQWHGIYRRAVFR
jgi:hypothetical protein